MAMLKITIFDDYHLNNRLSLTIIATTQPERLIFWQCVFASSD